jgi:N-acetylglucosaminyldiphosphoundecaprenol N-acetyl-beta-D-mannosaminyltransferase
VLKLCQDIIQGNKKISIFFVNAHCFNIAQENKEYLSTLNHSELVLNDGIGIDIACKLENIQNTENLNGTDLIPKVLEIASDNNYRVYLLGTKHDIIEKAVENIKKTWPKIQIAGYHSGFFTTEEELGIINDINSKKTDILLVGMGVPIQELWINKNRNKLNSVKIFIAGGAIIDFLSGYIKRAPVLWRKCRLEWMYRLIQEPKRLFKRYVFGNFLFMFYIANYKLGIKKPQIPDSDYVKQEVTS